MSSLTQILLHRSLPCDSWLYISISLFHVCYFNYLFLPFPLGIITGDVRNKKVGEEAKTKEATLDGGGNDTINKDKTGGSPLLETKSTTGVDEDKSINIAKDGTVLDSNDFAVKRRSSIKLRQEMAANASKKPYHLSFRHFSYLRTHIIKKNATAENRRWTNAYFLELPLFGKHKTAPDLSSGEAPTKEPTMLYNLNEFVFANQVKPFSIRKYTKT